MVEGSLIKVIVGDNQTIYHEGIVKILSLAGQINIVFRCSNGSDLIQALEGSRNCIVIVASTLELEMVSLMKSLNRSGSRLIILAEPSEHRADYAASGARDILYRNASAEALVESVRRAAARSCAPPIHKTSEIRQPEDQVGMNVRNRFTTKEISILSLVTTGWKNREIAVRLNTTEQVIKNYLRVMFDKAGVSDRLELALFTIQHHALVQAICKASTALGIQDNVTFSPNRPSFTDLRDFSARRASLVDGSSQGLTKGRRWEEK